MLNWQGGDHTRLEVVKNRTGTCSRCSPRTSAKASRQLRRWSATRGMTVTSRYIHAADAVLLAVADAVANRTAS
jgi:hypothetical protein